MASAFAREPGGEDTAQRAAQLRERALELAEAELHSYLPVLEAIRLPPEQTGRAARIEQASRSAAGPPLEIARLAAEVAEHGLEVARTGSPHLIGDAVAGTLLAEAACRAAAQLVAINLADFEGDEAVLEARAQSERAWAARNEALASVRGFPSDHAA